MSDEPTLKLYALAIVATRTVDNQTAIGVQSALALLPDGAHVEEASRQAAQDIFPESDDWTNHYATATEIKQGFPLEPYHLIWRLEKDR